MKIIKWNLHIHEKKYMIELEYSSILKNKIKVYVDGIHMEGVKVILDEIGADYYFNINDKNILIYYRPIKTNVNHYRIALDEFDYETDEKIKCIDPMKSLEVKITMNNLKKFLIKIINVILIWLVIYICSYFNNLIATMAIAFCFTIIMDITNELFEKVLFNRDSLVLVVINEIKKMDDKREKVANILELLGVPIFAALLAVVIHMINLFLT